VLVFGFSAQFFYYTTLEELFPSKCYPLVVITSYLKESITKGIYGDFILWVEKGKGSYFNMKKKTSPTKCLFFGNSKNFLVFFCGFLSKISCACVPTGNYKSKT
jgi:hypothetical protein